MVNPQRISFMNTIIALSLAIPALVAVYAKVSHLARYDGAATPSHTSTEPFRLVALCISWLGWAMPLAKHGLTKPTFHASRYVTRNHTITGSDLAIVREGYLVNPISRTTELIAAKDSNYATTTFMCSERATTTFSSSQQLANNAAFFFVLDHLRKTGLDVSANGISGVEAQYGFRDPADSSLIKVFTLRVEDTFECRDSGRLDASAVWDTFTSSNDLCSGKRNKQTKSWVSSANCTETSLSIDTVRA